MKDGSHTEEKAHPAGNSVGRAFFLGAVAGVGAVLVSGAAVAGQQILVERCGWAFLGKTMVGEDALGEMRGIELAKVVLRGCLLSPLWEEFLFRGILQGWILRRCPKGISVVLISLLFAGFHLDVNSFLPLFCVSLCFSVAYQRVGNLVVPLVGHVMYNTFLVWGRVGM